MNEAPQTAHSRLLVGLDLTETGDRAFNEALLLANELPHCELHVGHVIAGAGDIRDAKQLDRVSNELNAKLSEIRMRVTELCAFPWIGKSRPLPIVFHIRLGDPAEALHQLAVDVDATLIVVGTHARTGVQKLLLGSVADVLTRTARVSVLVAHPKNFAGLPRSETLAPPLPAGTHPTKAGITQRVHVEYRAQGVHISGLI